jgi:hypothetical protein
MRQGIHLVLTGACIVILVTTSLAAGESTLWRSFGSGVNGPVSSMIMKDGDLFVAGRFDSASGQPARGIARWDGVSWHQVGTGLCPSTNWYLFEFQGLVTAVYEFQPYGSTDPISDTAMRIGQWDGSLWKVIPKTIEYTTYTDNNDTTYGNGYVIGANVWGNKLILSGVFDQADTLRVNNMAVWNGTGYEPLGPNLYNHRVEVMSVYNNDPIVAVTSQYFNGSYVEYATFRYVSGQWQYVGRFPSGYPHDLNVIDGKLFLTTSGTPAVLQWADSTWIPAADAIFANPAYETLESYQFGGVRFAQTGPTSLAYWDGTRWHPDEPPGGAVAALLVNGNALIVGGSFTGAGINNIAWKNQIEEDGDGFSDYEDNCPHTYNPDQLDVDNDSIGDVCDTCIGCGPSVFVDHIDGTSLTGDTLFVNTPITIYLGFSSFENQSADMIGAPFRLYSNDGAAWQTPVFDTIPGGWIGPTYGIQPCRVIWSNSVPDGTSPDTVGMVMRSTTTGYPPLFKKAVWSITTRFSSGASGKTFCIDTGKMAGKTEMIGGCGSQVGSAQLTILNSHSDPSLRAKWSGPYCFAVANCSPGMSGNIDCDPSGKVDIADLTRLLDYLYISQQPLCCPSAANVDGHGWIDISDLTRLIDYLYLSFRPLYSGS